MDRHKSHWRGTYLSSGGKRKGHILALNGHPCKQQPLRKEKGRGITLFAIDRNLILCYGGALTTNVRINRSICCRMRYMHSDKGPISVGMAVDKLEQIDKNALQYLHKTATEAG